MRDTCSTQASRSHRTAKRPFQLIWEIPLAVLSFLFFKGMKVVIGNLYIAYLGVNQKNASQWRVLSAKTMKTPLSLPVLMTKGPRWNTHAIIGTVGPIQVTKTLSLDLNTIQQSTASWTAAIYSFPTYKTVGNLGSLELSTDPSQPDSGAATLELPRGKYTIGLRYYQASDTVTMPTVTVDGVVAVPAQPVAPDVNRFYKTLAERNSWFYQWLHYYVFTILKFRHRLPEAFVRYEYLPVGAPETAFFYGAIARHHTLHLQLHPALIDQYDTYVTVYNRASFPLFWEQLHQPDYTSQPMPEDGTYLLRIRPKANQGQHPPAQTTPDIPPDWIHTSVHPCGMQP